jgi:esterase
LGQGTPLLILHGFLGMSDNWRTHARYWSSHFEVHAIDQRNHGKSFHDFAFDYGVLAKDMITYMDAKNMDKAIVLGHSMGGKTAMSLALQYPERVQKLIVADIAPKEYKVAEKFSHIIDGLLHLDANTFVSRTTADEALATFVPEVGVRQFLLKNLAWTEQRTLKLRCNIQVLQHNLEEIGAAPKKATFKGETLFLGGKNSDYIVKSDLDLIHAYFPKATLNWIPDAGHWLHAENPKAFTTALRDFLI